MQPKSARQGGEADFPLGYGCVAESGQRRGQQPRGLLYQDTRWSCSYSGAGWASGSPVEPASAAMACSVASSYHSSGPRAWTIGGGVSGSSMSAQNDPNVRRLVDERDDPHLGPAPRTSEETPLRCTQRLMVGVGSILETGHSAIPDICPVWVVHGLFGSDHAHVPQPPRRRQTTMVVSLRRSIGRLEREGLGWFECRRDFAR